MGVMATPLRPSLFSEDSPRNSTRRIRYNSVNNSPLKEQRKQRSLGITTDDRFPKRLTNYHGYHLAVFKDGTVGTSSGYMSPYGKGEEVIYF